MKIYKLDGTSIDFPAQAGHKLQDAITFFNLPSGMSYRTGAGDVISAGSPITNDMVLYVTPVVKAG